jgi:lipopolysaccharide/colanic/teichoic acid biosynthesis glycosyltransferase
VLLVGALALLLGSGRPVFYRQVRVGRGGEPFTIVKLRTMRPDAEDASGEALATTADPRVTGVGRWLRRHRIDEIPQLWNVLAGSMSLVGPRPERPGFADVFSSGVAGYAQRYVVPPGVTGLAQVHGDYHSSPETKIRYDLAYIANWSLWLDLTILIRTVKVILTSPSV